MTERITIDNFNVKDEDYTVVKDTRKFGTKESYAGIFKKFKKGKEIVATVWLKNCQFHGWHKSDYDKMRSNQGSTCLTWEVGTEYGDKTKQFSDQVVAFYNTDPRANEIRRLNKISSSNPIIPPVSLSKDGKQYMMYVGLSPESFVNPKTGKPLPGTTVHSKDKSGKVTEHSIKLFESLEFDCNFVEIAFELSGTKNYIKVKLFNVITGNSFKKIVFGGKDDLYSQIPKETSEEDTGVMDLASALRSISISTPPNVSVSTAAGEGPETSAITLSNIKTRTMDSSEESEEEDTPPPILKPNVVPAKTSSARTKQ